MAGGNHNTWKFKLRKMIWSSIIILFLVCVGLSVFIVGCQGSMVYHPSRDLNATPADGGLKFDDVYLTTTDGVKINGWFVPAENPRGTVLVFHGNAMNMACRVGTLQFFNSLGLNVFMIDYRGYGRSEGSPSENGTYADAEAAWDYLVKDRGISQESIVIFGRSLGGAIAIYLAEKHPQAAGLIVESGFTSVMDMAERVLPLPGVRHLIYIRYDSIGRIGNVKMPVMIIHSPDDDIIPYSMGEALYAKAPQPKEFLKIHGPHNGGWDESMSIYRPAVEKFVNGLFGQKNQQ